MIAGEHVERGLDAVEYRLDIGKFGVGPLVGEVAVHHDKVERAAVDFVDGNFQLLFGFIAGRYVHVAEHGDVLAESGYRDSQEKNGYKAFHIGYCSSRGLGRSGCVYQRE